MKLSKYSLFSTNVAFLQQSFWPIPFSKYLLGRTICFVLHIAYLHDCHPANFKKLVSFNLQLQICYSIFKAKVTGSAVTKLGLFKTRKSNQWVCTGKPQILMWLYGMENWCCDDVAENLLSRDFNKSLLYFTVFFVI